MAVLRHIGFYRPFGACLLSSRLPLYRCRRILLPVFFSDDVQNLGVGTQGTNQLSGTGGDIKRGGLITGNVLDISTSVTLSQSDWLLFTNGSDFGDLNGNPTVAGQVFAFGGSGDNTIMATPSPLSAGSQTSSTARWQVRTNPL